MLLQRLHWLISVCELIVGEQFDFLMVTLRKELNTMSTPYRKLQLVKDDPWLEPVAMDVWNRYRRYRDRLHAIEDQFGSLMTSPLLITTLVSTSIKKEKVGYTVNGLPELVICSYLAILINGNAIPTG